ncbi:MAG: hypothetical protein M1828_001392 [Chrysothrix sp. TS-e1954]|nr:MAG: hypothetical protein M1828_001392 [Chrysothrix sp. TS-e1954]
MALSSGILKLSNELLRDILDQIEADPDKLVSLDRRAYLSQESFRPPPPPSRDQAQDIGSFRLVCRRFANLGAIHQFARVTTRFSRGGFQRLEGIAGSPHIARHVKKFSYMVPYFYVQGRERASDRLSKLRGTFGAGDIDHFTRKANEQYDLVRDQEDSRVLRRALTAFRSLQHVQILRVQDQEDAELLIYIRRAHLQPPIVELQWEAACSHSTKTLGKALLASKSPCSRFSSPMLSPRSAEVLAERAPNSFGPLVQRLTSLELHFDDQTNDLDQKMLELSGLFKTVFDAAHNMQAVHVGFPSHRPLSLRLEDVFHHVKWEKLCAFGIQAWKLDAEEVIGLAERHRDRLRGLRLRDVLLKEGSKWSDVLRFLRDDMTRLDWVSLRRIGYAKHFDEQSAAAGFEIADPPGGTSDSDEEDNNDIGDYSEAASQDDAQMESDDAGQSEEDEDDESGPQAYELGFPGQLEDAQGSTLTTAVTTEGCNGRASTGNSGSSTDDLGDDGIFVSNLQRKEWERWVLRRSRPK